MGDESVTDEGDAPTRPPTVLISYSHDSPEHERRVLALANRLRTGGVDCRIDLYEAAPAEGWPLWMDRWLRTADFVLMICTEAYLRRARGEEIPGRGLGVRWESSQIYRQIYEAAMANRKFIPCVFTDADQRFILDPLRSYTHYVVGSEDGYEKLYRRLTGQPETPRPPLGPLRTLPALAPKHVQPVPQAAEPVGPLIERIARGRKTRVRLLLAAIGVIATIAAGLVWRHYSALTEVYATSWVIAGNRIVPLGRLTDDQQRRRWSSFRLTLRDSMVVRIERVSGAGAVRPLGASLAMPELQEVVPELVGDLDESDVTSLVPHYDRDGGLYEFTCHARDGTLIRVEAYSDSGLREWYRDAGGAPLHPNGPDVVGASRVLDEQGRVVGVRFLNTYRTPRRAGNGAFGIDFRRDVAGAIVQRAFVLDDGQPVAERGGEFLRLYDRDARSEVLIETALGIDNVRTLGRELFHRHQLERDDRGNVVSEKFFDTESRVAPDATGAARRDYHYDEHGNLRSVAYFDARDNPVAIRDGYARIELDYDDGGREKSRQFLDRDGHPATCQAGYARVERSYDALGNEVSRRFYHRMGKPTLHKDGYAGARYVWRNGHVFETTYLDRTGSPAVRTGGYAQVRVTRDQRGHVKEWAVFMPDGTRAYFNGYAYLTKSWTDVGYLRDEVYHDASGRPTPRKDRSFASARYGFNDYGDLVSQRFFDAAGQPTLDKNAHCAGFEWEYDSRGRPTSETCVGPAGTRILNQRGCARALFGYDAHGNFEEVSCLDEKLGLSLDRQGISVIRKHYNPRGEETVVEFLDDKRMRTLSSDEHFSKVEIDHDARGNETEKRYFDEKDAPTLCMNGIGGTRSTYDERGNQATLVSLGLDFKPETASPRDGSAQWKWRFDDQGHQIETRFFDAKGAPVFDGARGAHAFKDEYDSRGNLTARTALGIGDIPVVSNAGYARREFLYDDQGQRTEDKILDAFGQLTDGKRGYAIVQQQFDARGLVRERMHIAALPGVRPSQPPHIVFQYDPQGRSVGEAYLDTAGVATAGNDGIARRQFVLDEQGRQIEILNYGTDGKLLDRAHGIARIRQTFDAHDNPTSVAFFDPAEVTMDGKEGFAREERAYDEYGRENDERYFDVRGKLTSGRNNVSHVHWRYDARGREVERMFYGLDDKLTFNRDLLARVITEYDRRDNLIERRYYGTDGVTLAFNRLGFARRTAEYDVRGNPLVQSYYGLDGTSLIKQVGGYARQRREYDARRLLRSVVFEDERGGPAAIAGGIARLVLHYDAYGNETGREVFGAHGEKLAATLALIDAEHSDTSNHAVVVLTADAGAAGAGVQPGDVVLRCGKRAARDAMRDGKLSLDPGVTRLLLLRWRLDSAAERTVDVPATAQIRVADSVTFEP